MKNWVSKPYNVGLHIFTDLKKEEALNSDVFKVALISRPNIVITLHFSRFKYIYIVGTWMYS